MASSPLVKNLRSAFEASVRTAGMRLHRRAGAVEILYLSEDQLFARLPEGKAYAAVIADVVEGEIGIGCSCEMFRTADLCPHLWAALLTVEMMDGLASYSADQPEPVILTPEEFEELESEINRKIFAERLASRANGGREDVLEEIRRVVEARQDRLDHADARPASPPPEKAAWEKNLEMLGRELSQYRRGRSENAKGREVWYVINGSPPDASAYTRWQRSSTDFGSMTLAVGYRDQKKNGEMGVLKYSPLRRHGHYQFLDQTDGTILAFLWSACYATRTAAGRENGFAVPAPLVPHLLDMIAPTGRLMAHREEFADQRPVVWNPEEVLRPELRLDRLEKSKDVRISLCFTDGTGQIDLNDLSYLASGLLLVDDRIVRVGDDSNGESVDRLVGFFLRQKSIDLPKDEIGSALTQIATIRHLPSFAIDEDLAIETTAGSPTPKISFRSDPTDLDDERMEGVVTFRYDGKTISAGLAGSSIWLQDEGRMIVRDSGEEAAYLTTLGELGFQEQPSFYRDDEEGVWTISRKLFVRAVSRLIEAGWEIEAEGRSYRTASKVEIEVTSGIDWFDLDGTATFDGGSVPFPELLRAIREGERFLTLDDGTYGLIPEEWVGRYGRFSGNLDRAGNAVTFKSNQVMLLDILLDEMPEVSFDQDFQRRREQLQSFNGVGPMSPPKTFTGDLRHYQQVALGWFSFLRDFNFGGCLADDMGLGKTVQVLALLEERRSDRKKRKPSLAVVPKSLIFNWMREAETFAPKLKILDYTGTSRREEIENLSDYHVILTTYGTLRRDIEYLKEIPFDYVILDESQAIKNARSATAKSARLLQGDHRLAMSGTPIENRLEELWSLFEFLNPGMLGSSAAFRRLTAGEEGGPSINEAIGRTLRPFILRRTKLEVAPELPERVEQTIYCELGVDQRKEYDELKEYIRAGIMEDVGTKGIGKSSFKILEGLLRLRQAASHPGLIDRKKRKAGSAKFDLLLPKLVELAAEGEKVLIFSQFTTLLDLLKPELKREKLRFEYLDGKTKDRQACVDTFQNSPDIPLFLISLKAGGIGLNLTAASWVFLLDPWWNPAVEAQAIDRTHRIGQTSTVFANRLIVRDTIEEKVLALQQEKRELADSILNGKNSMIGSLTREDLELLLS